MPTTKLRRVGVREGEVGCDAVIGFGKYKGGTGAMQRYRVGAYAQHEAVESGCLGGRGEEESSRGGGRGGAGLRGVSRGTGKQVLSQG